MTRPWIYLINPFISATENSYRKAKNIGDYTLSALDAAARDQPPENIFNTLFVAFAPVAQQYGEAYANWQSRQGTQKGQTKLLNDLLDELRSEKIEAWDLAIQNEYRQETPQYIALLPRRRAPFQTGSQQDRITAVNALSITIGTDNALQTLKTEVDNFYDALMKANNTQKGSKTQKNNSSTDVETKRLALCTELYGVLGSLVVHFKETPEAVGDFFLLEELRSPEQTTYRHDIGGDETLLVFVRSFEEGEDIRLTNRGNTDLKFARVPQQTDTMPGTAFILPASQQTTVTANALGANDNRFLIVQNVNANEKGAYTVELM